ncbi:hypothetical protein ACQPW1_10375 [Nocardia sp. CA-128927]|uniref:hypothetical protein n=1 Tax=Nocardia sp. CA-128927 TaxID=3239975 RepID=UPI003D999BA8
MGRRGTRLQAATGRSAQRDQERTLEAGRKADLDRLDVEVEEARALAGKAIAEGDLSMAAVHMSSVEARQRTRALVRLRAFDLL